MRAAVGRHMRIVRVNPWPYALVGAFFGVIALAVALIADPGGHGTHVPAQILFPYAMLLASLAGGLTEFGILLALVQFVAYGLIAGWGLSKGRERLVTVCLFASHALALLLIYLAGGFDSPSVH
jgi:hypothetical protein